MSKIQHLKYALRGVLSVFIIYCVIQSLLAPTFPAHKDLFTIIGTAFIGIIGAMVLAFFIVWLFTNEKK
jgi:uncharacterized membrane protein YeaQ/YmgE (transglycosylase-associated protein family)